MKRTILWVLMGALFLLNGFSLNAVGRKDNPGAAAAESLVITDMAGRNVTLPSKIRSVYSSNPVGTMLMYTFDDTLVAGTNWELAPSQTKYATEYYRNLPNLGGWYGRGNQGNIEEIIKAAPDFVLSTGVDRASIDSAEQLQRQLGIPVVLAESEDIMGLAETYRFLGKILGNEKRGEELAVYTEAVLKHAADITAKIPERQKIRVYYAEEADGLHTDPSGSWHSRLIDICGGINVAQAQITPGYGRTAVSIEQVILWDPDLIIACIDNGADTGSYHTILTDPKWAGIKAVRNKLVFPTPIEPQNWFDRPPSVNTVIGIKWVQALLYPELVDYDIKAETKAFYKMFYHVDINDADVASILKNALRE
ncbi:MAG: ABC transporter substrate-binding protein [Spirochaetaceae bacterium]|nr:ABC transporter substrate-binding protein [Spirochaetaceae bacterium]